MNIELPERFFYSSDCRHNSYVQDGILYVEGCTNYEHLMYSLSYGLKGYETCAYCGRKLESKIRTLDHMYPRNWGGVSIPENLLPACTRCNNEKNNLTTKQYMEWLSVGEPERGEYRQKCIEENRNQMQNSSFILPKSWVTPYDTAYIVQEIDFEWILEYGNIGMDNYFETNHHYPRPIIVSANNWVFQGLHILYHAKMNGIRMVPAIILENVIRIRNSKHTI